MSNLKDILSENVGKSSYSMRDFFQGLVKRGELRAYRVEVDKVTVEKDTKEEHIQRTKKGATLTPTREIGEYQPTFVEDPKTGVRYNLDIGSHGGMFFNDGDSQTIYHHCVLERLVSSVDLGRIGKSSDSNGGTGIRVPSEMVVAELRMSYSDDWESGGDTDYVARSSGNLSIRGEKDGLFEKVQKFLHER